MSDKPLTIAIVSSQFFEEENPDGKLSIFQGGLASYTYRLAKSLQMFGHTPILFVSSRKSEKVIFDGIEVHRIGPRMHDEWLYQNKFLCKPYTITKRTLHKTKLWKWVEDELISKPHLKITSRDINSEIKNVDAEKHFDVIHFTHLSGVGYYRPKNIPSIGRLSSHTSLYEKGGGYGRSSKEMLKKEEFEVAALKKMDAIFGPSRMIAEITGKEINRDIKVIESIFVEPTDALDLDFYKKHLGGKKYLLWYGTAGLIKGAGTIAEIIHPLLKQFPEHYFVFIGKTLHSDVPGLPLKDYIINKAGEFANRLVFFDTVPHPQLYPIIENAELCALPSRIDNFPNTCIEAMAHGKIVIGTIGNGFEQLIDDKKSGYLIKPDDHEGLLRAMTEILTLAPDKKKEVEQNAKKRIDLLRPESIVPQVIKFYTNAIAQHNRMNRAK